MLVNKPWSHYLIGFMSCYSALCNMELDVTKMEDKKKKSENYFKNIWDEYSCTEQDAAEVLCPVIQLLHVAWPGSPSTRLRYSCNRSFWEAQVLFPNIPNVHWSLTDFSTGMEGRAGGRDVGDRAKSCNPLLLSNTETSCLEDEVILIFGFWKLIQVDSG